MRLLRDAGIAVLALAVAGLLAVAGTLGIMFFLKGIAFLFERCGNLAAGIFVTLYCWSLLLLVVKWSR